jgi:sugar phosphate isomerase/epimerase
MNVLLGVDTLTYHCRIEAGEISHEQIFTDAAELGFAFVQLNAYHLRELQPAELSALRGAASDAGIHLTLSGDVVGRAGRGDTVESGVGRLAAWIEIAELIGSPFVRCSSGFYRNELMKTPGAIADEQKYVTETLAAAAGTLSGQVQIVLENHSDFTPDEYVQIIEQVGSDRVRVFLDVINPVTMLLDPLPVVERLFPWASAGHVKDFKLVSRYVPDRFHRTGFDVQYCYPGEGVANLDALLGVLARAEREGDYRLAIEALDSQAGVPDQRERLTASLARLSAILARG